MFRSTCLVAMPCAIVALLSLISLFLKFWALLVGCRSRSRGLGLHPHTQAYIKGFGSFPHMHVYACLLLCFMSMFASLVLGFAMLSALHGLDLVWLHPTPVWLCLGVTTCEMHLSDAGLLYAYPFLTPCDDMLPSLACAPFAFLCFYASLHACLLTSSSLVPTISCRFTPVFDTRDPESLQELCLMASVCRPYSNTMELWTLDPNLHLSSQDTTFCLITCLLAHCVLSLFVCPRLALLLVCSLHAFYLSFYLLCSFLGLSTSLFPCLLHVHAWSKGRLEQGHDLLGTSKKGKDASPKSAMFSRLEAQSPQAFISFYPPSLNLFSRALYQAYPLCTILRPHSQGMAMSDLSFLYLVGPYPRDVDMYLLSFLHLALGCIPQA